MSSVSDYVVSFVEGRVRLRHGALKDPAIAAMAEQAAGGVEGVTSVRVNPVTGSLLLFYDPERLSREELLDLAEKMMVFLPEEPKRGGAEKSGRSMIGGCAEAFFGRKATRLVDRTLFVSLLLALAGAVSGAETLHRVAGAAFSLASLQHVAVHRRVLW